MGNIKLNEFENKLDEISEEIADAKKELRLTKMPANIRKKCGLKVAIKCFRGAMKMLWH